MWLGRDSSNLWLETFELISRNGFVALDSDVKEKITMKGYCLGAIYRTSSDDNIPSFIITAWDCKTKLSVVCEKEPAKFRVTDREKANFPCIPGKQNLREKRQDSALTFEANFNAESFVRSPVNNGADPSGPNAPKIPTSAGKYWSHDRNKKRPDSSTTMEPDLNSGSIFRATENSGNDKLDLGPSSPSEPTNSASTEGYESFGNPTNTVTEELYGMGILLKLECLPLNSF